MKPILISISISVIIIGLAIFLSPQGSGVDINLNNVFVEDGKQFVEIRARGGYFPKKSIAKAGIPTILKIETTNTYDCSLSFRIPSMNVSKMLPSSGNTEIDIGTQQKGKFIGTCSMGMYGFEIDFI